MTSLTAKELHSLYVDVMRFQDPQWLLHAAHVWLKHYDLHVLRVPTPITAATMELYAVCALEVEKSLQGFSPVLITAAWNALGDHLTFQPPYQNLEDPILPARADRWLGV